MSSAAGWESTFLAVSAVLGEPLEASVGALGDEGAARAAAMLRGLRSESREQRARAIASGVSEVAVAIDAMRLR